jgi:SAM-dependent methyltransferase
MPKKKEDIISLVSKLELNKELVVNVRKRSLEQKSFYISDKMSKYYYNGATEIEPAKQGYGDFLKKNLKKNEKIAIISLGCGNASREKLMFDELKEIADYNIVYVGVDISEPMLKKAKKI